MPEFQPHFSIESIRQQTIGLEGRPVALDNAATTLTIEPVRDTVNELLDVYGSVHRGAGENARVSTEAYERSREIVGEFVGANEVTDTVVFTKNTTEAINILAGALNLEEGDVVLRSVLDHHSNDLPWRSTLAQVHHIEVDTQGRLDIGHLDELLQRFAGKVKLVTVSGGSNVTGHMPDISLISQMSHEAGALIAVDCAQLAPHRAIDMQADDLDFIALSGHKLYAPFGGGALVGKKQYLAGATPPMTGGGTIKVVTDETVRWAELPDRFEAGTPNAMGAVAMAAAMRIMESIGMENIAAHEAALTRYALGKLATIEGLKVYGDSNPDTAASRLGVIPFNLEGISHQLVAAELGHKHNVSVRNGCFCAHPYVTRLLQVSSQEFTDTVAALEAGDKRDVPGMVRMSFGMYSNYQDIDALVAGLRAIHDDGIRLDDYTQDRASGEYVLKSNAAVQESLLPKLLRR
ncbi:MAG TPA: aminotransferase class V-fold PLP-dependent enzyme [Candidatus Saccharimonadales bacterium]